MEIRLENTKIELIQWLTTLEDRAVIQKILDLKSKDDWWGKISDAEKESIEKGISDANSGKLSTQDKAEEIYGKWL